MATLVELAQQGRITKYDPELPGRNQEERLFYLFERAQRRIEKQVAEMRSLFESEIAPLEQLAAFLEIFCRGDRLHFGRQFSPIRHIEQGVWELKTRDLRLFGWFAHRDCFVCTSVDDATRVKELRLYEAYREEAVRDRDALPLDEPKFIPGVNPNAVISNFR